MHLCSLNCTTILCNVIFHVQIFNGLKDVNVSHVIHDLSFGPSYPGIHNPLDGTTRILHDTSGTFKYYIKVNFNLFYRFSLTALLLLLLLLIIRLLISSIYILIINWISFNTLSFQQVD